MKTKVFLFYATFLFAVSCNVFVKEIGTENQEFVNKSDVAVEIIADYRLISYKRAVNPDTDSDFMSLEVKSAMSASRMYKTNSLSNTKSGTAESTDTLTNSEQIPFCADVSEVTNIYRDGKSEFYQETELNPDMNPLLGFHDEPLDLKNCLSKVEIKDGVASTYNNVGERLSQIQVQMPDYSEYLEELSRCQEESNAETKTGIKRDINWLKHRMESQSITKGGPDSYRIYEADDGKVVLEQDMVCTKSGSLITIRTFLSPDISKNFGYEQLVDGKLKVRCSHYFLNKSLHTRSSNLPIDNISEENPSRTLTEELSYLKDGTPMIAVLDKTYQVNKVNYNLK